MMKLNPKLFDGQQVKPEVKKKKKQVKFQMLIKTLEEAEIPFKQDLVLTGSNASYNYTKDSDADILNCWICLVLTTLMAFILLYLMPTRVHLIINIILISMVSQLSI